MYLGSKRLQRALLSILAPHCCGVRPDIGFLLSESPHLNLNSIKVVQPQAVCNRLSMAGVQWKVWRAGSIMIKGRLGRFRRDWTAKVEDLFMIVNSTTLRPSSYSKPPSLPRSLLFSLAYNRAQKDLSCLRDLEGYLEIDTREVGHETVCLRG